MDTSGLPFTNPEPGQITSGLPNWTRFADRPIRRPEERSAWDDDAPARAGRGLMLGAGFLALRVQVDVEVAEESGKRVRV